jgi:hypothetical protein
MLNKEDVERQITEMWDAIANWSNYEPGLLAEEGRRIEKELRKQLSKQELLFENAPKMLEALQALVICPAFSGQVFEKDKESHKAWTLARLVISEATGTKL